MIFTFLNISIIIFFCIYWCINEKIGLQLSIVILLSAWTIHLLNSLNIKFPFNIEIGWFAAGALICGYIALRKLLETLLLKGGMRAYLIATAVVSFSLIIYHPSVIFVIPGGVILGLGIGHCLNRKFIGFDCVNILQRKGKKKYLTLLARLALGVSVLILMVYRVEKIIFSMTENQNVLLYGFLCYAIIGFWITVAAPWLFIKLRLAGTASGSEDEKQEKKPGT